MSDSRESRTAGDEDFIEDLVFQCLEAEDPAGKAEELYRAHPDAAPRLKRVLLRLELEGFTSETRTQAPSSKSGVLSSLGQDLAVPERLGDFRLGERLGAGGMGVVFLADDTKLSRKVAVKVIRPEQLFFAGARERFQREIEAIARLQHPGIVRIHSVGEEKGVPFYAMEYVPGISLARLITNLTGTNPARLRERDIESHIAADSTTGSSSDGTWNRMVIHIIREVADALAHAHDLGVLHRDVKPSNILIADDRRPRLLDFGLARTEGAQELTQSNAHLGSLPYLPPEQFGGTPAKPAPTLDVYALGVTMYELLTLHSPFLGQTAEETRARILAARPAAPRTHNASIGSDLETVCLTAMDPNPARRYGSMRAFVADLDNLIARRPVVARPVGVALRAVRWCQRHPTATVGVVMGCLLLAAAVMFGMQQRRHAQMSEAVTYELGLTAAHSQLTDLRVVEARASLDKCPPPLRRFEWRYLDNLWKSGSAVYQGHTDGVRQIEFHPSGREFVTVGEDGRACFWRLGEQKPRAVAQPGEPGPASLTGVCYSADGERVFASSAAGAIFTWQRDGSRGRKLCDLSEMHGMQVVADPRGRWLAVGALGGKVKLLDAQTGAVQGHWEMKLPRRPFGGIAVQALAMSPDGRWLAAALVRDVCVFDTESGSQVRHLQEPRNVVSALRFNPDGTNLYATSTDGFVHHWRLPGYRHRESEQLRVGLSSLAVSEATGMIAGSGARGPVILLEMRSLKRIHGIIGYGGIVNDVALAPDQRTMLTGSGDGRVVQWPLHEVVGEAILARHRGIVRGLGILPGGEAVVSAGQDGRLLWSSLGDGKSRELLNTAPRGLRSLSLSPDGKRCLVTVDRDRRPGAPQLLDSLQLVDIGADAQPRWLRTPSAPSFAVWLRDGEHCIAGRIQDVFWCLDVDDGALRATAELPDRGPGSRVAEIAAVPWSDQVIALYGNGTLFCWEGRTLKLEHEVRAYSRPATGLGFDPVRKLVLLSDIKGRMRFFDPATGVFVPQEIVWGSEPISAFAQSPDGSRLVTASMRSSLHVWDRQRMRYLLPLSGHRMAVLDAAFTPDGHRLISSSMDGTVRIWDARPKAPAGVGQEANIGGK